MRRLYAPLVLAVAIVGATACDPGVGPGVLPVPLDAGTEEVASYTHPNPDVERWHAVAIAAGWTEAEWPVVSCIMEHPTNTRVAESRGNPDAYNGRGPDRSRGLMQINTKSRSMREWFFARGLNMVQDLFDPHTNLHMAKLLSDYNAVSSWAKYNKWWPWKGGAVRAQCFRMEGVTN